MSKFKMKNAHKLKEKGWSDEEIHHAQEVLDRGAQHDIFFSRMVFWTALLVTIIANTIVSFILVPFLIALTPVALYSVVILLGGSIGFLYSHLIRDISHLEKKHHLWAGILIPIIALSNMLVTVFVSNNFIDELQLKNSANNPWIVGVVFGAAFILPYLVRKVLGK